MSSPRLKISRQAQSAVPEELDILLLEHGIPIGMYPVHIISDDLFMLQGADAHAPLEGRVVAGVEPKAPDHLCLFFSPALEGSLDLFQSRSVLFQSTAGIELNGIPVGNAVEVDIQDLLFRFLVGPGEGGGAKKALFLVVEEHEADLFPVLIRHSQSGFQQRNDTAGVVIGGVLISGAVQDPPDQKDTQDIRQTNAHCGWRARQKKKRKII